MTKLLLCLLFALGIFESVSVGGAQEGPPPAPATTVSAERNQETGVSSAPLKRKQLRTQRRRRRLEETAASESAKAQQDRVNALKHEDKALNAQDKLAGHPQ